MKRKYIFTALLIYVFAVCIFFATDVNAEGEVDHIFDAERIMQFDEGTRFENGIVNGGIINPGLGKRSTYIGIKFDKTTYKNEECVKVELLDGHFTGYFDFNYYQWDAKAKKPALDASKYSYLKIRYSYPNEYENIYAMKFWASKETALGKTIGAGEKSFGIVNNGDGWSEAVVRVDGLTFADGTLWLESTIRQFRIYMFEGNTNPDAVCYIAGMGFFETKEEAEAYDFKTGAAKEGSTENNETDTLTKLVKNNQMVVGILFGFIIGVIIAIIVVAVIVNVSLKKRY